jgi:fused signal recognition particle receptor
MDVFGTIEIWILLAGGGLGAVVLFFALRFAPPTRAPVPEPPSPRPETVATVAPAPVPPAPPPAAAPSPAARLRAALAKTRDVLRTRIDEALRGTPDREQALASLEEVLVSADVGIKATQRILERVRSETRGEREGGVPQLKAALARALEEILGDADEPTRESARPWVILVAGVNGVGKTTSIGKLAARFHGEGKSVLLVAGDTFRAAAIDQLGIWGERVGIEVVRHQSGSDPAAVAFDGVKAARAREVEIVIVDTAGRLHTRQNLMDELRKVVRVIGREQPGAPHEVLLVVDATTGQNAVAQARIFREAVGVTGIVLTKLDGTAKGGAALAVREELGVPIRWIGVGEGIEDLRPFSAADFVAGLLGDDPDSAVPTPRPSA